MREKQLIQLLQFILIWVLICLFVIFVLEESFVDFLLKYRLYFLIVSVSYFYYYSIQYDPDKKFNLIRNVIIYGNLYLFAHVFFRPLLNISHELFVFLWLIILWMWWTTKLTTRWRYVLQAIWWIFTFFILISWIFYLYPDKPDVEWFIKSRKYQISVSWIVKTIPKKDAYIQIVGSRKTEDFEITPYFEKSLNETSRILYPSLKKQRDEKVAIITPYWDVFWLFPQSEVSLEFDGDKLKTLSKLNWRVWYLSWLFSSSIDFIWGAEILSLEQQEWIEWKQDQYKYDFVLYLKNQISENNMNLANSTVMYNIDWKIIGFLARMFPAIFAKNLRNYNDFQNYFKWVSDDEVWLNRYSMKQNSWWSIVSFWKNLVDNMKVWKWNTYNVFKKH